MGTRERVLELLKQGKSQAEIARLLGISKSMVGKHLGKLERDGLWLRQGRDPPPFPENAGGDSAQNRGARRKPSGGQQGNTNAVNHGEFSEFWRDVLTEEEQLLLAAAEQRTPLELARQQVALCDLMIRRLATRIKKLEELPLDLVVESESNLVKHVPRADGEEGDERRPMPAMTITRSTTVRDALVGLYRAQREFLKIRGASIQLLNQVLRASKPATPQPKEGAGDYGDDLSQLSDDELAERIRQLGAGLGGGEGGPGNAH